MDLQTVQKAYSRWSRFYDWIFGPAFERARSRSIAMLDLQPGDRILEVGVGTGLSFPHFPSDCQIVGVDISQAMLVRAHTRAERSGASLVEGDVGHLPFRRASFDAVLAPFVVSAVPDPVAMMREVSRVTRDGARVVLLNHFVSENKAIRAVERAITPTTTRTLGFHADFDPEPVLDRSAYRIEVARGMPPLGYWKALRVVKRGAG